MVKRSKLRFRGSSCNTRAPALLPQKSERIQQLGEPSTPSSLAFSWGTTKTVKTSYSRAGLSGVGVGRSRTAVFPGWKNTVLPWLERGFGPRVPSFKGGFGRAGLHIQGQKVVGGRLRAGARDLSTARRARRPRGSSCNARDSSCSSPGGRPRPDRTGSPPLSS